jgi:Holliday junction resolvase
LILFEKEYSPKITEKDVKKQVRDYLRIRGWFVFSIWQGGMSYKGISDLIAIKKGKVLFVECKSPKGQLRPDQKKFKKSIEASGGTYIVARGYEDIKKEIG